MVEYVKSFIKWLILAVVVGTVGGLVGSAFHICVDVATEFRINNSYIIYLLPIGGLIIVAIYHIFRSKGRIDTNRVIEAVRKNEKVPFVMIPLIFVSTVITHLFGGSAGREGAALQLGGGIGYNFGKLFKLGQKDMHIIIMAGMSSLFAAVFGTPLTAAVFALEVISVGMFHYVGLFPCLISSVTAYMISLILGVSSIRFDMVVYGAVAVPVILKVIVLGLLCALLSIIFCTAIRKTEHFMDKFIHNNYLRAFAGGVFVIVLTLMVGTYDYNGAGMDVIGRAISGKAEPLAFLLKIVFTVITISAGFKGGEIVPTFFIGSTFGCVVAPLLGLESSFGAAIGLVALFCGVVNCPIASVFLSFEVFGADGIIYFAIASAVSYMMSGYFGLYESQKIVYSKLTDDYIDISAK